MKGRRYGKSDQQMFSVHFSIPCLQFFLSGKRANNISKTEREEKSYSLLTIPFPHFVPSRTIPASASPFLVKLALQESKVTRLISRGISVPPVQNNFPHILSLEGEQELLEQQHCTAKLSELAFPLAWICWVQELQRKSCVEEFWFVVFSGWFVSRRWHVLNSSWAYQGAHSNLQKWVFI